jgi:purine-binding chemotaxis protein CheW
MVSEGVQQYAALVCVVGSTRIALPLASVIEVMRPLPIEAIGTAQRRGVLGVSVIRGAPTVVLDATVVLGQPAAAPGRFVTLRTGDRIVALAVQDVVGVEALGAPHALPPLLRDTDARVLDQIAARDTALLAVLETSHLYPE